MNPTLIEWVKNPDGTQGYTWNPITGCLNGCPYCYARKLANGRLRSRYLANHNTAPMTGFQLLERDKAGYLPPEDDPFYPRFWEDRLDDPFLVDRNICIKRHTWGQRRTPRGIFVCDMGELFGDWIPREWQEEIFLTITCNPQHRFYLLTKQPQNLPQWSPFPDNCWVGVTATDTFKIGEALGYLSKIEARIKYLSIEPLLDRILYLDSRILKDLNWLILGAQTKPYKPPDIKSVEVVVRACDKASVPVFLKDNLANAVPFFKEPFCQEDMGEDGIKIVRLRQEVPE